MDVFWTVVIGTIIGLALVFLLDALIPRTEYVSVEFQRLFDVDARIPMPVEAFGRPWDPKTLPEFLDEWMEMSVEDKFYYSTECWNLDLAA